MDRLLDQYHGLESDTSWEPVEVTEKGVLDALRRQGVPTGTSCISGGDQCLDQKLSCFPPEEGPDPADIVEGKSAGWGTAVIFAN